MLALGGTSSNSAVNAVAFTTLGTGAAADTEVVFWILLKDGPAPPPRGPTSILLDRFFTGAGAAAGVDDDADEVADGRGTAGGT